MRHRSPKTENNYANNFLKSPKKRQFNIIPLDNKKNNDSFFNKKNYNNNNNNNHLIFNYNKNNYNYYDEITKAFNFITFVLKQKDLQIQELKIKIKDLEKQLNDINETNIMTFNNQDVITTSSNESNLKFLQNNKNMSNKFQNKLNLIQDKNKGGNWNTQIEISNNNSNNASNNSNIINIYKNNNFGNEANKSNINNINNKIIFDNNNINIIHKTKNSTNRVSDYRNATEIGKKNINFNLNYNNKFMNDIPINSLNVNTNEHSNEKKNINKIRKESYHSNQNININLKNKNEYIKLGKNLDPKNLDFISDNENINEQDKIKILNLNNYEKFEKSGSRSNSFNLSDDGNMIISKKDVKNYLKEVKNKLEPDKFKKFISYIKNLTKNKSIEERNIIILQIKNLLVDKILISKFENIMKGNKN